jgi:hypothetical protein
MLKRERSLLFLHLEPASLPTTNLQHFKARARMSAHVEPADFSFAKVATKE